MFAKEAYPGTSRSCSPEETLRRILPELSYFGIETVMEDTQLQPVPIPVFQCVRPEAKSLSVSYGKGYTKDLAKVSAIMESIEYHAAENLAPPDFIGNFEEAKASGAEAVKPSDVALFPHPEVNKVKIPWLMGKCLHTNHETLIPRTLIDLDFTQCREDRHYFFSATNGLASGNTRTEALVHGLLEVIERHCMGQSSKLNPKERSERLIEVNFENFPLLRNHLEFFKKNSYACLIEDMSFSEGIYAFYVELQYKNFLTPGAHKLPFRGAGCHLNPEIALARAIAEAVQVASAIVSKTREDLSVGIKDYNTNSRYPVGATPRPKEFSHCTTHTQTSFEHDLKYLLSSLQKQNFYEAYFIDLTEKEPQVPVVFSLVPGMRFACL